MDSLTEEAKKLLLAGIGAAAFGYEKSKKTVSELVCKGELIVAKGKVLNEELHHNGSPKHKQKPQVEFEDILSCLEQMSVEQLMLIEQKTKNLIKAGIHDDTPKS